MKKFKVILYFVVSTVFSFVTIAYADDVHVRGYYRSNGTYVQPHVRSAPDSFRWNNYGPSQNSQELARPRLRDNDRDSTPNYLDPDDDNDSLSDDLDPNQYGRTKNDSYFDLNK